MKAHEIHSTLSSLWFICVNYHTAIFLRLHIQNESIKNVHTNMQNGDSDYCGRSTKSCYDDNAGLILLVILFFPKRFNIC